MSVCVCVHERASVGVWSEGQGAEEHLKAPFLMAHMLVLEFSDSSDDQPPFRSLALSWDRHVGSFYLHRQSAILKAPLASSQGTVRRSLSAQDLWRKHLFTSSKRSPPWGLGGGLRAACLPRVSVSGPQPLARLSSQDPKQTDSFQPSNTVISRYHLHFWSSSHLEKSFLWHLWYASL